MFKEYSDEEFFNCQLRGANNVVNAVCGEKDFSNIPPDVLRRAGERGSAVHKAIEEFLKSDMTKMPQIDLEYLCYIQHLLRLLFFLVILLQQSLRYSH